MIKIDVKSGSLKEEQILRVVKKLGLSYEMVSEASGAGEEDIVHLGYKRADNKSDKTRMTFVHPIKGTRIDVRRADRPDAEYEITDKSGKMMKSGKWREYSDHPDHILSVLKKM